VGTIELVPYIQSCSNLAIVIITDVNKVTFYSHLNKILFGKNELKYYRPLDPAGTGSFIVLSGVV